MEWQNPKKRPSKARPKVWKDLKRVAKEKGQKVLEEPLNIMEHLELMMFMAEPPDCTADMVTSPTSPSLKGGLLRRNYIIFKI